MDENTAEATRHMETTEIGQYVLEERLGSGGMAEVWKARNAVLGNHVAIKFLNRQFAGDTEIEQRFLGEGKRQATLQHPNIVSAFDFLYVEGRSYLVMKYVKGENLEDRLIRLRSPLPLKAVLAISNDVLGALGYAHSENIIHRDIKPSNILLENSGRALVMDFGIAVVLGEKRVTRAGVAVGTPHYMSPEQIVGSRDFDQRSDIYSYGCVLYQMLTERPPFDSEEGEGDTEYFVKNQHVHKPPQPPRELNPDIPEYVEAAVLRCLEKRPADRFSSCADLLEAISAPPTQVSARPKTVLESPTLPVADPIRRTQLDSPVHHGLVHAAKPTDVPVSSRGATSFALSTPEPANLVSPDAPAKSKPMPLIGLIVAAGVLLAGAGGFVYYRATCCKSAPADLNPGKGKNETPNPGTGKTEPVPSPQNEPPTGKVTPVPSPSPVKPKLDDKTSKRIGKDHGEQKQVPITPVQPPKHETAPTSGPVTNVSGPTSGVLRCPGNPVPQGGTVQFTNLPKGRLKYEWDRSAWRLSLKNGLDGSKTVVLESLAPGVQTSCEVRWTEVP